MMVDTWENTIKYYKLSNKKISKDTLIYIKSLMKAIMSDSKKENIFNYKLPENILSIYGGRVFNEKNHLNDKDNIKEKLGYDYDKLMRTTNNLIVDLDTVFRFMNMLNVELRRVTYDIKGYDDVGLGYKFDKILLKKI